jgi:hypothetical protein
MGYWKREYTQRGTGKPLFRPEPKDAPANSPETGSLPETAQQADVEPAAADPLHNLKPVPQSTPRPAREAEEAVPTSSLPEDDSADE